MSVELVDVVREWLAFNNLIFEMHEDRTFSPLNHKQFKRSSMLIINDNKVIGHYDDDKLLTDNIPSDLPEEIKRNSIGFCKFEIFNPADPEFFNKLHKFCDNMLL